MFLVLVLLVMFIVIVTIHLWAANVQCHVIEYASPPESSPSRIVKRIEGLGGGGGHGGGGGGRGWDGRGGRGWGTGSARSNPRSGSGRWGSVGGWGWPDWYYSRLYYPYDWVQNVEIPVYPIGDFESPSDRYLVRINDTGYTILHSTGSGGSAWGRTRTAFSGCGQLKARINLERGKVYEFDVYTETECGGTRNRNEPFIFSQTENGPELFGVRATTNGTIRINTLNAPAVFYYRSTNTPGLGGVVTVS